MAIQRLLLLLPVAGAAFVAASPLPRPASVRPVLPRASVPVWRRVAPRAPPDAPPLYAITTLTPFAHWVHTTYGVRRLSP